MPLPLLRPFRAHEMVSGVSAFKLGPGNYPQSPTGALPASHRPLYPQLTQTALPTSSATELLLHAPQPLVLAEARERKYIQLSRMRHSLHDPGPRHARRISEAGESLAYTCR